MAAQRAPHYALLNNIRFYILSGAVLLSLALVAWVRQSTPSDSLWIIRTEQLYGLVAIGYWYVALLLSPLQKTIGLVGPMPQLLFSRRAIGVSAAYFATLHALLSFFGQEDGFAGLHLLPLRFNWSLGLGLGALVILLIMAATSFDVVVRFMTYRRWKLLHRLGYAGGLALIVHVWLIGSHTTYPVAQHIAFVALVILFGLEAWRLSQQLVRRFPVLAPNDAERSLFIVLWLAMSLSLLLLPAVLGVYHGSHNHSAVQGSSDGTGQ